MGSSSRFLELKLMGCKGLQAFNFFQKLKVFAVVSLTSDNPGNKQQQQQRTKTDTEGDKDPEWNQEMRFDLDAVNREDFDHLYLHIDLRYEFFGEKSLGEVRVPLTDLVGDFSENYGVARFVSYEIRNQEHKPNGYITFSYKVVGVSATATSTGTTAAAASNINSYGHIDGYTVVHNHDQQQQQLNQNINYHRNDDHEQNLQQSRPDQEFSYNYSTSMESSEYRIQYPAVETPPYLPTPAGEGYSMSYSRLEHHQFQYPPPPPPHPPPELARVQSYPFPPPPPPPFPPPQSEFTHFHRMQSDPFPPPPFPPHHHHHHHHHVAHEAAYPPPSTGDLYEHSYGISRRIYFNEDGTPRY